MKFKIQRDVLVNSLKNVNNFINNEAINPALSGVNIEIKDQKLIISATDGSNTYREMITDVITEGEGTILVKCKLLFNIVSRLDNTEVTINKIDDAIIQISTQPKFSCELNLFDASLFPVIPYNYEGWNKITLNYDTIQNINDRVLPFVLQSTNNQNQRSVLGIHFKTLDEKQMECIGCDSIRVGYYKFDYEGDNVEFTVGPEMIKTALDILNTKKCKTLDVYLNQQNCILSINNTLIKFGLIGGIYPNVINTLLAPQKYKFTIKWDDLYNALNRGSVFALTELNPITNLKLSNNKLSVKFVSQESGNSFEEIEVSNSNVDQAEFKLNHKIFIDLISRIKADTITFNFNGEYSHLIITSENPYFINLITQRRV